MFALPAAKRVRRSELYSKSTSPASSPDPAVNDLLRSKLQHQCYDVPNVSKDRDNASGAGEAGKQEVDYVEFNLFRPSSTKQPRIRLRSPTPVPKGEAGFLNPERPRTYYYASPSRSSRRKELQSVAVSGDDVRARAYGHTLWPGCALPWRVSLIKVLCRSRSAGEGGNEGATLLSQAEPVKRRRAGKKRRIAIRKKLVIQSEKQQRELELQKQKMESEREKRTRQNRLKKVRKKQKEKARKSAGGGGGTLSGAPVEVSVQESNGKGG